MRGRHLSVNKVFKEDVVWQFTGSKGALQLNAMRDSGLDHGAEKKCI